MFSNRIDTYTPPKEDKLKSNNNQNFDFDGDGFSSFLDDKEVSGKLRETDRELDEDESILSTDDENKSIAKQRSGDKKTEVQPNENENTPKSKSDELRLLKLMEMSTKVNMSSIKISKSKKELESISGSISEEEVQGGLSEIVAKVMSVSKQDNAEENQDIKPSIDMSSNTDKMEENAKRDKDDNLHETQDEILEDLSILSTDEENLAIVNNKTDNHLTSEDFSHNGEEDMELLSELTSIHNQANIKAPSSNIETAKSGLIEVIQESKNKIQRIDASNLTGEDVDYITDLLKQGTADSSDLMDDNSKNASVLSEAFLAKLKDAILNKKIFRIDFDNEISVIIRINEEGKISANFLTNNKDMEENLKNNLYVLRQKFEEQNIKYGKLEYTASNEDTLSKINISEILNTIKDVKNDKKAKTHEK